MIDDVDSKRDNHWLASTSESGFFGNSYLHDNNQNKGQCSAQFEVPIKKAGNYELRLAYTANPNRATNVPVTIASASGTERKTVNQKKPKQYQIANRGGRRSGKHQTGPKRLGANVELILAPFEAQTAGSFSGAK